MSKPTAAYPEGNLQDNFSLVAGEIQERETSHNNFINSDLPQGHSSAAFSFLALPEQLSPIPWSLGQHDIYKGVLNGSVVAVKCFRIHGKLRAASETQYLRSFPDADRMQMMISVVDALEYLHSKGVVHGDLHSRNILIDDSGKAVLADYGVSQVFPAEWSGNNGDSNRIRYQAPELISGEAPTPTMACDVYSFGVTISATHPYSDFRTYVDVVLAIYEGQPPYSHANKGLAGSLNLGQVFWDLMLICWSGNPGQRPGIGIVREELNSFMERRLIR
ncbi:hypothetical protein DXG01_007786 [Tephrocybe rancida]|nr:hypothetical protein DXG01_007786 [Tephrocybe rancida]